MAKDTRWDRNLSVAADADGLIGHAGAVLLRKLADHEKSAEEKNKQKAKSAGVLA